MVSPLERYSRSKEVPPIVKTSVVVTNYNYGYYLDRCIRSLANQSDNDYNIIVVDDASGDYSKLVLRTWEDQDSIHIIENVQNIGLGASCNKGILASRSRYIVRVDSDDFVSSEYVRMLSTFLDLSPKFDAVACDYYNVSRDNKLEVIDASKHPIACGIMYRKEVLIELGLYNEDREVREDIDMREKFDKRKFKMAHLQVPLYRYNIHGHSMTNRLENKSNGEGGRQSESVGSNEPTPE
jgi:glycosyltransferase involved in cell wall biosynthesis